MRTPHRNIIVLLNVDFMSEHNIKQEVENLNEILRTAESPEEFCIAHELIDRNRITSKPHKILKAVHLAVLKPFRFLINKN